MDELIEKIDKIDANIELLINKLDTLELAEEFIAEHDLGVSWEIIKRWTGLEKR